MKKNNSILLILGISFIVLQSCYRNNKVYNSFSLSNQAFSVVEDSPNGTVVGTFEVPRGYSELTFSLVYPGVDSAFSIDAATGQIAVANSKVLTRQKQSEFTLIVKAVDKINESITSTAVAIVSLKETEGIPTNNLLLYYSFDGNANDLSNNHMNGLVNATLTDDRFGKPNSAFHFNGENEYIDFPYNTLLKPQFPFTISLWAKLDQLDPSNQLITTDFALDIYTGAFMAVTTKGTFAIGYGNGEIVSIDSRKCKGGNTILQLNQWYHLTGVYKSSTEMEMYINGEYETSSYSGYATNLAYSNNPGSIGRKDAGNSTQPPYYYRGSLDEVGFWSRALTESEIRRLSRLKN